MPLSIWSRSNEDFWDTLIDDCYLFSYGIDLTKEFSIQVVITTAEGELCDFYDNDVLGVIQTDERFARMSAKYDAEQKELTEKIKATRDAIDKSAAKAVTTDMFISAVRKYTRAKKLTSSMVDELIDHIEVQQAEKVNGVWEQRLTIHYNCVGVIDIPETLPMRDITMNTRKGVFVNYAPSPTAT